MMEDDKQTESVDPKRDRFADVALTLGILSVFPLPLLASVPAIIVGHLAAGRDTVQKNDVSRRHARTGLILGYSTLIIGTLILLVPMVNN